MLKRVYSEREYTPFFDSKDKPTSFEVDFIYEDIEYRYGYSLKDNVFGQECLYEFKGSEYQIIFEHDTVSKVLNVCDEMKETIDILNRVNEKKFLEQFMVDYFDCIQVNKVKRWGCLFQNAILWQILQDIQITLICKVLWRLVKIGRQHC